MHVATVSTISFDDQNPGTSGLRKKTSVFMQKHYTENFFQALLDTMGCLPEVTVVLGGDGRFFNKEALQIFLKMAAANGIAKIIVGKEGLLSTPALSYLMRQRGAQAGIMLSASHNKGGAQGDFGIKYNVKNGGAAPPEVTKKIYERTKSLAHYKICQAPDICLAQVGLFSLNNMAIEIVDSVALYADFMEELFDFVQIRSAAEKGLSLCFDAMHAVTGPYAVEIFEKRLGFAKGSVLNNLPLPDFGGQAPDPNPNNLQHLLAIMGKPNGPSLGAASDGDGDRNFIMGQKQLVAPSDSLAVLLAHSDVLKYYQGRVKGVARSMPTSKAVDQVAAHMNIPVYETPTGWKFFCSLLDANKITFCGEESFGTSSDHIREKDGIWAVLFWLNLLAKTGKSVAQLMQEHWQKFGRYYYQRYDYEEIEAAPIEEKLKAITENLALYRGKKIANFFIEEADNFSYTDPITGAITCGQGLRFLFSGGARLVARLSGTGTSGVTLRLYLEQYEKDLDKLNQNCAEKLKPLFEVAEQLFALPDVTGGKAPHIT